MVLYRQSLTTGGHATRSEKQEAHALTFIWSEISPMLSYFGLAPTNFLLGHFLANLESLANHCRPQ